MTVGELHQQLQLWHKDSFGWALRCCMGNEADAEDVLQTVYLKILEGKAEFKEKSSFRTWLFSIIRFTAIDAMRRQKVRQTRLELLRQDLVRDGEAEEVVTAAPANLQQFQTALEALPERQREVLQLVFYHDCSIAEAATIMGVSLGSARTHYERAKAALRKVLDAPKSIEK